MSGGADVEKRQDVVDDGYGGEPDWDALEAEVVGDGVEAVQGFGQDDFEVGLCREVVGELVAPVEGAVDAQVDATCGRRGKRQSDDELSPSRPDSGAKHQRFRRPGRLGLGASALG